ncbi:MULTISPECIES: wax ester/triacylglycerol synthase family O-acyltransferase [unclassified Hydrogenophaga]|uniref:wax ester/triacylglycerol synthase family O-acyltransferase n=1 Tax=unclassified Hydrogenophaga TaxID=2610897 RepID=UPI0009F501E3|nr:MULTISPECIES: wax ester/triacylglycerol synthase family O-acyltransferase [unclassified Hydrogenophaga]MBN9369945.1 wax ester/triacylglycerol synthase family O-acyltransferase [Hydrogenophaga sp.]
MDHRVAAVTQALSSTLGLEGERMSKVDTAWLRMDSPANLMMIVGVWVLRPGVTREALEQRVRERLLPYRRFRQIAREDAAGAAWIDDPDFDLARHVTTHRLRRRRGRGEREALQDRVGQLAVQRLDPLHPLWHFELIEHCAGGSALIARIHHCIADGIALIGVMMSLVDGGQAPAPRARRARRANEGAEDWLADTLIRPLGDLTARALQVAGGGAAKSLSLMAAPQQTLAGAVDQAVGAAHIGAQLASDVAALALMPDDSATRLKGTPGAVKRVAWCEPIPLDAVKAIGRAFDASVNDVLLSCVAGAIGQYLRGHGDDTAGQEIRAMVPINLRPLEDAWKLGNRFGLVPLLLPIGMTNPVERLYAVREGMRQLKGSLQPLLTFALLSVAGLLIKPAQDALLNLFGRKTTAVMTNVPGPGNKLQFCGSTLEQTMFWVPQSGTVGLGVSVLSYGGGVQFGVIADAGLCPDPQAIIDGFEPAFQQLLALTLMLPWGPE